MQTSIESCFDARSTAAQVLEGVDLSGKFALVTGANSGIGRETARALADAGAHVTVAVRNASAGEELVAALNDQVGAQRVEMLTLDLMSPSSIRACADAYAASGKPLHLLINNAGIMAGPFELNVDGVESQLQSNALGPLLLTLLLAPSLAASAPSRVVMVSSSAHRFSPILFEDINFENRPYHPMLAYGQSKTAVNLLTIALSKRLSQHGVTCLSVHPGVIQTNLTRYMSPEGLAGISALLEQHPELIKSIEAGAATSVWAATAPELVGHGGSYLEDCHVAHRCIDGEDLTGVLDYSIDAGIAERIWEVVMAMPAFTKLANSSRFF